MLMEIDEVEEEIKEVANTLCVLNCATHRLDITIKKLQKRLSILRGEHES
jgi:predicted nuclease with TOPRIM domain